MRTITILVLLAFSFSTFGQGTKNSSEKIRKTKVAIVGNQFYINGKPTFEGRSWNGHKIEGLLPNSRMVQGIFDDENPATNNRFAYPDTKVWDADRNTNEFIEAMPLWYAHGLLAFTINMQGGSPLGYGNHGWINTAFDSIGNLKPAFMFRLEKILDKADELGMVPILGLFYFGQDEHLKDEQAIRKAVINTVNWILERGYTNILIEIANECDHSHYDHEIIKAENIHELILLAKSISKNGNSLLTSASFCGGVVPFANVVKVSDFILFHGNDVKSPERIIEMVKEIRALPEYNNIPIVNNEDDHFDFDKPMNNFVAATSVYASWGYFDFRKWNEPFETGYQSVPVDWGITTDRKKGFFNLLKEMTGSKGIPEDKNTWQPLFKRGKPDGWLVKAKPEDKLKNFWTAQDSAISANSLSDSIHDYVWLVTDKQYDDFELKLLFQVFSHAEGNSGIQIRSRYDDKNYWLDGPQIDIQPTAAWRTGMMWDKTRDNQRWIFPNLDTTQWVKPEMAINPAKIYFADTSDVWNLLRIKAEGTNIKAWLNGTLVTDYNGKGVLDDKIHKNNKVGMKGHIALQIHKNDKVRINFKDIYIK